MSQAVLLLAHGTPDSVDQIPQYLTLVRDGRPAPAELVAEITRKYAAIGGRSPLADLARAQAEALHLALGRRPVYLGMRSWRPFIREVVTQARRDGVTRLLAIPLAPQYSSVSVGRYRDAVERATPDGLTVDFVSSWHDHPGVLDAFAEKARAALRAGAVDEVVFSAHALPIRTVEAGDPYPDQVAATARGVAQRLGLAAYRLAWQSAGRTPEPWLRPSLTDVLETIAGTDRRHVLIIPVGFVCDHTEILFDIDIQAKGFARDRGIELRRSESLNTSATFIKALAEIVHAHAE